jgi:hypothetical protein
MATAKSSIQRRLPDSIIDKGLEESLPIGVQKGYFLLNQPERALLNFALDKYRAGQSEPILVGGQKILKPALRLAGNYRLVIEEIRASQVITSYTRWIDAVQVSGVESPKVYLTFSPRFEHIWLELKKLLPRYLSERPTKLRLRSQLGQKICQSRKQARLFGTTSKGARSGINQRRGREHDSGSAFANLGELASKSLGYGDCGNK